ncbi:MAG TPA: hypothetical protein VN132_12405, partial [Bdellovibrio sp.]|nr:hypothetical protein [Bdellovibrio sp.]
TPLTYVLRAVQYMGKVSVEGVQKFSEVTGLDQLLSKSFDQSGKSLEYTYDHLIEPALKLFITKNTTIFSGSVSATAVTGGSVFLMMNDAKEAMSVSAVRSLLGQDQVIRTRIDSAVSDISDIYNLNANQQSQLKEAIYDDIIRQAIENDFSENMSKYHLDIVKIMAEKHIVDSNAVAAIQNIRKAVSQLTASASSSDTARSLAIANTDLALQLAALLESQLNNNKLQSPTARAEIERMLGSVSAKLALVGFNLKQ